MPIFPRIRLSEDVEVADTSLTFQAIGLIAGIIAMAVSCILREDLAGNITLDDCEEYSLLQIRIAVAILVFVALIYYFLLSVETLKEADTPCDYLSAKVNLMASFLVLAASALRLYDLTEIVPKILFGPEEPQAEESEAENLEIEELPLL